MTNGIAKVTSIDLPWLLRVLTAAGYDGKPVEDDELEVGTEYGPIRIGLNEWATALRLYAVVGASGSLPADPIARHDAMRELQIDLELARLAHYPGGDALMLEYEIPLLAGLSRLQWLAIVRGFIADLVITRRAGLGRNLQ